MQSASIVAMLGASIAAPLAMAPTVNPAPFTSAVLGTVSVVMMARAAAAPDSALPRRAATIPARCGSTSASGKGMPMSPVWQTRISCRCASIPLATAPQRRDAASRPGSPVAALALPEVRITPADRPPVASRWARLICTGAAAAKLPVKTPGGGDRPAVIGCHHRHIGYARSLDPGRTPGGHEPLGCGDAHGYNPASGNPVVSGSPRAMLAHWTAWPDAPFTRLSSAHSESTQPVRSSTRAVTWAQFDPAVALVEGGASVTTTKGSSS